MARLPQHAEQRSAALSRRLFFTSPFPSQNGESCTVPLFFLNHHIQAGLTMALRFLLTLPSGSGQKAAPER